LTAVPAEGCEFEQWSGDIGDNQATNGTISVTMDMNRTISAGFKGCAGPLEITVDYSTYSSGTKTINSSFGSIVTSAIRTSSGTTVNATATAAEGYRFDGWAGAINGSESTASFVATPSESITARFSKTSSSIWTWAMIGAILVLLAGAFYFMIKSGRKKRPQEVPASEAAIPPQPTPPPGE